MKKIIITVILLFMAVAAWMYFNSDKSADTHASSPVPVPPQTAPASVQNDLPYMTLEKADGSRLITRDLTDKAILYFFLPDCDHCQREATQIQENIAAFKDYSLYFISTAPFPEQQQFAQDYKLAGHPNIYFAKTTIQSIFKNFGPIPTPSLFIYAKGGRMIKSFKGETPIGNILASLKQ
jgi:protein-disulfide isomerase